MATKLQLFNTALRLIGERSLASLTEAREPRYVLDEIYTPALYYCLEQGLWNFAKRTIEANDVPSVTPTFGFTYAFTKPDDWIRTVMMSGSPTFDPPLNDYEDEQEYWYANITPIYCSYVSNDDEYGFDLAKWPMTFTRFVEAHLAAEICERLTQNASKHDMLRKMERARLSDARSKDAMNEPARFTPMGRWARSRSNFRVDKRRWDGTFQ